MESVNHTFLQVVKVPHAELWHTRDSDLAYSGEGDVQILHSQALNQFILRINDFKVILDKSEQIIGAIVGRHQRQAYILPRGTGFSMIRLQDGKTYPSLQNFETILENTSSFSRKSGLDSTLCNFKEVKEGGNLASSLLTSIAKTFSHSPNDYHPNQKIVRSFEELLDIDSNGVSVVDMPSSELDSLSKKKELDGTGSEQSDVWKSLMGEGTFHGFGGDKQSDTKNGQQRTSDMQYSQAAQDVEMKEMGDSNQTRKYHPSIDHQEFVGAQEQRLPSYEVHNSKEFLRKNLRKASANVPSGDTGSGDEQKEKNVDLPEPENFDEEAFTSGLLSRDTSQVATVGTDKDFPISNEDAFTDLRHPMRKFSSVDRPFLGLDEEAEHHEAEKSKVEGHKGFQGQPILTAKGQPTLKSNIDDQPSPIPNTEKYSEPSQPEKSSFSKSSENGNGRELTSDTQPIKPSTLGQQNIVRESSQGNETKKHRKAAEPVDKENLRSPTAI